MPAATPQEAATNREQNSASGIAKYRAKLQQMRANSPAAPPALTSVEDVPLLPVASALLAEPPFFTQIEDIPLLPVVPAPPTRDPPSSPCHSPGGGGLYSP